MLYPLKFKPLYKDYIWGGRNLEMLGKALPEGTVAESWEISCHPAGVSIISNGEFEGISLPDLINKYGRQIIGSSLPEKDMNNFPLLIKLIDANDRLSVQVHPNDAYALVHENGELGKNEAWYIISAKPGAKLVYDVVPGTTKESFANAIKNGGVGDYLKYVEVYPGDVLNIPAGLVHAIGEGIVIAEIQQNSNTTYRVYDYDRVDKNGNKRPLHVEKALEVIDFSAGERIEKCPGLEVTLGPNSSKFYKVANKYFSVETYTVTGVVDEVADGSRFFVYLVTEGSGEVLFGSCSLKIQAGESVLVPASMGCYTLTGKFKALKSYVPDLEKNVIAPLRNAGYSDEEIYLNVNGLRQA